MVGLLIGTLGGSATITIERYHLGVFSRGSGNQGPERDGAAHMVAGTHEQTNPYGYIHRKDDYLKRLRRIEGQARGLQKMVGDEKYCIDILTQVSAMTSALQSVALVIAEIWVRMSMQY